MNPTRWIAVTIVVAMFVWILKESFAWGVVVLGFSFLLWAVIHKDSK
jgi:hypothetical protein